MSALTVRDACCGYAGRPVVEHVSFELDRGEVLVLLGPNGVGKTTLFKTVLGLLAPVSGSFGLDGHALDTRSDGPDMRRIAYVPQAHVPAFAFTVLEIVLMGRTPRMGAFAIPSAADRAAARQSLADLGLEHLADRPYTQISGGERQMVLIARALVQEPDILVMDEPAASLDLGNQARLLSMVRTLSRERGMGVLMTTHQPDHALLVADKVLLLARQNRWYGPVEEVLTDAHLSEAYGAHIAIIEQRAAANDGAVEPLRSCVLRIDRSDPVGSGPISRDRTEGAGA